MNAGGYILLQSISYSVTGAGFRIFTYLHVVKTLIVHPQDPTTTFLCGIYKNLANKTVITGGVTKDELRKHIQDHDRILMMGYGSPASLFSVGRFPGAYSYIVDDSMAESLFEHPDITTHAILSELLLFLKAFNDWYVIKCLIVFSISLDQWIIKSK